MKKKMLSCMEYKDKVLAGWIGKSLGGVVGAPYENHKVFGDVPAEKLWPSFHAPNDDPDIQIVWLEAMQERVMFLGAGARWRQAQTADTGRIPQRPLSILRSCMTGRIDDTRPARNEVMKG